MTVTADPGKAGVDDVMDARHRQGGLGDIGRQHHPPGAMGLEDPRLLRRALAGIEGQDLGRGRVMLAQGLGGLADLPLAGEKDQDIAPPLPGQLVHRLGDGDLHLVVALARVLFLRGAIAHLHRIGAPADLQDRRRPALGVREMGGKPLGIDGGGGDDDLEVRPPRQQATQITEEKVDIEAPLVGLVNDEGVVFQQQAILLQLRQQDAVRHQLDAGLGPHPVMKAHLVAHQPACLPTQFLGHPARQGARRDAPRLGVADPPGQAPPQLQADLRQLGGLARARLAAQDHHLMAGDERRYFLPPFADRQLGGKVDFRYQRPSLCQDRFGGLDFPPQPGQPLGDGLTPVQPLAQGPQAPAQTGTVSQEAGVQIGGRRECGGDHEADFLVKSSLWCMNSWLGKAARLGDLNIILLNNNGYNPQLKMGYLALFRNLALARLTISKV